jgi:multidrug efflux pump subunit AcrA (membrane-fusion protein)
MGAARRLAIRTCVALLGIGGLLIVLQLADLAATACGLSRANVVVWLLHGAANAVSLGTAGLFTPPNPALAVTINSGTSALSWLAITTVLVALVRAATPADDPAPDDLEKRHRLPRASRILFTVVAIAATLETAGFVSTYQLYSRHYVYSDNANVDGKKIEINAPATGAVTGWSIGDGSTLQTNQIVGRIRSLGSGAQPERPIKAPDSGTVAANDVVNGTYVKAGTNLADAYDPNAIYVTARVKDTDISAVHPGAQVDIHVDAFPHAPVTGIVSVVEDSSAGNFTIYPPAGIADPSNPQRVDQYIPVKISLTYTGGVRLVPGMDVEVHIHKE